jgi:hypothetical protein
MPDVDVLLSNKVGPLPISVSFQNTDEDPLILYIGGSAWSPVPNTILGIHVLMDGKVIDTVNVYANEAQSHKTLVGKMITVPGLSLGKHTITLQPAAGTVTDGNDVFSIAMLSGDYSYVLNYQGAIPHYTTFTSNASGPCLIFLSGSAYSGFSGTNGISLVIDSNVVLASSLYMNEANSHHAFPGVFQVVDLTPGEHQIGFSMPMPEVQTDQNDFFCAAVFF